MPASKLGKAIIKTVVYADIFDYPLTLEEIGKYLINIKYEISNIKREIKKIKSKNGYYFLKGREGIVELRKKRKKWSEEKLRKLIPVISLLKTISPVKLIGVTGALAVENAKEEDDIDLFIITQKGSLWTTRFLITFLLDLLGKRRHPDDIDVNNKICLNMFADEDHLQVPKSEQDLFSAHEVVQMRPVFERENTYTRFLRSNMWVKNYLPNAIRIAVKAPRGWQAGSHDSPEVEGLIKSFNLLERFLKSFQLWYMRKRRTNEVIKEGIIRFHPHDARKWILKKYKVKLARDITKYIVASI